MREKGHSFGAIARTLGFKRATDAQTSFLRALAQREGDERDKLVQRELARLDELEARIRSRDSEDPEKMKRRLQALEAMREMLRG